MNESPQILVLAAPSPGTTARGFTIVELLMVIAIMALIVGLCNPSTSALQKSLQLTQATQMVGSQLELARQMATTRNHPVEVRFYQFGDPQTPGEQASNPASGKYRALQSFEVLESGTPKALGKVLYLPASVIIDSGVALSSLIGSAQPSPFVPTTSEGTANGSIPHAQNAYNLVSFRFQPDGSTNLPKTSEQQWFLTLHYKFDGNGLSSPPKNFSTLQINASNGHIKSFRP